MDAGSNSLIGIDGQVTPGGHLVNAHQGHLVLRQLIEMLLAEFTQHIPPKGSHLIRYYGWYSHRGRGMGPKLKQATPADHQIPIDRTALGVEKSVGGRPAAGSPSTWAMLIKRIYEVDPLECGKCGSEMKISFIERDQRPEIEWIS